MSDEPSEYAIYRRVVSQLMNDQEQLPSLPQITLEIRRSLSDPNVRVPQLVRLIGRDPALSAILLKHASSAFLHNGCAPKTLHDVVQRLGLREVDRLTMLHSIRSLFTLHSPAHKQLFMEVWERLVLKASICALLARLLGTCSAEHALLASLLSEVGTLAVLSAFKDDTVIPSRQLCYRLYREYSKSLGVIVLKKWAVDEEYIDIVRRAGHWQQYYGPGLQLIDLLNLALYHVIVQTCPGAELPELHTLTAYHKLLPPLDFIDDDGQLQIISSHRMEIDALGQLLR